MSRGLGGHPWTAQGQLKKTQAVRLDWMANQCQLLSTHQLRMRGPALVHVLALIVLVSPSHGFCRAPHSPWLLLDPLFSVHVPQYLHISQCITDSDCALVLTRTHEELTNQLNNLNPSRCNLGKKASLLPAVVFLCAGVQPDP